VGKTATALALATHWSVEVISADSRQVYRRLDIGTAKPSKKELGRVPHHGIDILDPGQRYSAGRYAAASTRWIETVQARSSLPVVVGGTGLYVRALMEGLFREPPLDTRQRAALEAELEELSFADLVRWASRLDPRYGGGGRQRAMRCIEVALLTGRPLSYWQEAAREQRPHTPWYVVLSVPRPILHQRIERRAVEMVQRGLIEEVASVLAEGHAAHAPGLDGIGIKEAVEYLHGKRPRESVADAITISTRQYAKRQETWFRHQLDGEVLRLDATRPAAEIAADIAQEWSRR
jgi:tRNA dimethylallyltransferase